MANRIAPDRVLAYRTVVFLVAVAAAFGFGLLAQRAPRALPELKADDALTRLAPSPARPDVVIVALDDASVRQYGPVKSWPRRLLAEGLSRVESGKPKLVVMDLALDRRTHTGDDSLWRLMANKRNVALGMAYDAQRAQKYTPDDIRSLIFLEQFAIADNLTFGPQTQQFTWALFEPPVSDFTGSSRGVGVFLRETDPDGILRSARLFYRSTVQYPPATAKLPGKFPVPRLADGAPVALPSLALVAAQRVFSLDKSYVKVVSGDTVHLLGQLNPPVDVPVDEQGRMLIRYAGPAGRYAAYSFRDVASGKVKPNVFQGKVVLFGATAPGDEATQLCATPFQMMPRVEVTANALSTLMNRSYAEQVSTHKYHLFGTLILVGLATGLILMLVSGGRAVLTTVLLLLVYLAVCYGAFAFGHALLPILPGLLVILLTGVIAAILSYGPFRAAPVQASPTYVPPPPSAVR